MQPITLVLHDSAGVHAVKRALTTERERLAARSDLESKAWLDSVDALLARLDALVIRNLVEYFANPPPTVPHAAWRPKLRKAKRGIRVSGAPR